MNKACDAVHVTNPLPLRLIRIVIKVGDEFAFRFRGSGVRVPRVNRYTPILVLWQAFIETIHDSPGYIGRGHGLQNKIIGACNSVHLGAKHLANIGPGRFNGGHHQI